MRYSRVLFGLLTFEVVQGNNSDLFNYGMTDISENGATSYGQNNWGDVTCSDIDSCPGFPNKFPIFPGYDELKTKDTSKCRYCPEGNSESCGLHRQSPIDLKRDRGVDGSPNEKECPDWHWMEYRPDTCTWDDMKSQFVIERHALQVHVPQLPNGDIDCFRWDKRRYPRIDYSKGFPDFWWMQRTDIHVPSNHVQEGTRYAAEVVLAHFYEVKHDKNQFGHVSIFMQDYPDAESWPFLDKLICQWRKEEDKVRESCGLPPVEPYGRCALLRNQEPTQDWLDEAAGLIYESTVDNSTTVLPSTPSDIDEPLFNESAIIDLVDPSDSPSSAPSLASGLGVSEIDQPVYLTAVSPSSAPSTTVAPSITAVPSTGTNTSSFLPENNSLSDTPTVSPNSTVTQDMVPPPIDCGSDTTLIDRMCSSNDPCCGSPRSDTKFCWNIYDNIFPGEKIKSACFHCCKEPQTIAEARPISSEIPKTIECSAVDSPFRMCKENSCCSNPRSNSDYCKSVYAKNKNNMESICHYCCREPLAIGSARYLRSGDDEYAIDHTEGVVEDVTKPDDDLQEGDKVVYVSGKKYILRQDNFEAQEEEGTEYFQRIYSEFKHRNLASVAHEEDYNDIEWFPYEWLVKVGTEYYYRYEGTQLIPPCWEVVHWRVMKDPIRVHKRQIDELNRLLAWRLNPTTCETDTAGVVASDGNTVDLSRDVMYYHDQHRKVFCECKDWPSQFPGDQEWCKNWKQDTNYDRFYTRPYSFDSDGKWNPNDP